MLRASGALCDFVRSFASGFILRPLCRHTSRHGRSRAFVFSRRARPERERVQNRGIPTLKHPSHIVPVMVGDPVRCKHTSDLLPEDYDVYVQPIDYPTVPRGTESS